MGKVVEGRFKHGAKTRNPPHRGGNEQTKVVTGGNAKGDIAWLEEVVADLVLITDQEKKSLEWPWDVMWKFNGHADEVNVEFWEYYRRGARKCTGAAYVRDERGGYILDQDLVRIMRPCLVVPPHGSNVCQKHGGEIGHVKKAAQVRLAMASENAATTLIELSAPIDSLGNVVEQAQRIKAAKEVLDRVGIRAGVEVSVANPGYQQLLDELFTSEEGDDE